MRLGDILGQISGGLAGCIAIFSLVYLLFSRQKYHENWTGNQIIAIVITIAGAGVFSMLLLSYFVTMQ